MNLSKFALPERLDQFASQINWLPRIPTGNLPSLKLSISSNPMVFDKFIGIKSVPVFFRISGHASRHGRVRQRVRGSAASADARQSLRNNVHPFGRPGMS